MYLRFCMEIWKRVTHAVFFSYHSLCKWFGWFFSTRCLQGMIRLFSNDWMWSYWLEMITERLLFFSLMLLRLLRILRWVNLWTGECYWLTWLVCGAETRCNTQSGEQLTHWLTRSLFYSWVHFAFLRIRELLFLLCFLQAFSLDVKCLERVFVSTYQPCYAMPTCNSPFAINFCRILSFQFSVTSASPKLRLLWAFYYSTFIVFLCVCYRNPYFLQWKTFLYRYHL